MEREGEGREGKGTERGGKGREENEKEEKNVPTQIRHLMGERAEVWKHW